MKIVSVLSTIALLGTLTTFAATPSEKVNRFALACFFTDTSRNINFEYKFGSDGGYSTVTVEGTSGPSQWRSIYWTFPQPGTESSPELYVRFDSEMASDAISTVEYRIPTRAAPDVDCDKFGAHYNFEWDSGSLNYVDLFTLN